MNKHDHSNLSSGKAVVSSVLTTSSVSPFATYALPLLRAGYLPIPIVPGEKRPALGKGWQKCRRKDIRHARKDNIPEKGDEFLIGGGEIQQWIQQYPSAGLGVMCGDGLHELVAVDVDEEAVAALVLSILPLSLVIKRGRRGGTLFYRNGGGVTSENFVRNREMIVEILAGGRQTVLPPTIHPDTGNPYVWTGKTLPLWDTPIGQLSEITTAHVRAIEAALITHGFIETPKPAIIGEPEDLEHLAANRDRYAAFARRKLEMQTALLAFPRENGRRQGANNTALALGPYVAHGLISEADVWQSIDWASRENGKYAEPGGYKAVQMAFKGGMGDGMKNPLPKLTDDHPHAMQKAGGNLHGLPPAPLQRQADGAYSFIAGASVPLDVSHSPVSGSDGVTAGWVWRQMQPGAVRIVMEYEASTAYERMLIERLMPASPGLVAFIAGQSGAGKTFYAVGLAVALASGTPFLGFPCRERVGVIYVAAEGAGTIKRRIDAAKAASDITGPLPIGIVMSSANLMDAVNRDALTAAINAKAAELLRLGLCDRVGVTIIDSMTVAFSMEDEQGNTEATRVCGFLRDIGLATGTVAAPVHHFGKDKTAGLRGASAYRAASDHVVAVLGDRDETTGEVANKKLALTRSRSDEEGVICCFDLPVRLMGHDPYGQAVTTCVFTRTDEDPTVKPATKKKDNAHGEVYFNRAYDTAMKIGVPSELDGMTGINVRVVRLSFITSYPSDNNDTSKKAWGRMLKKMTDEIEGDYHFQDEVIYRGKPNS